MTEKQYTADDCLDVCSRLLTREALRLEREPELTKEEIDLVVRIARGAAEVVALQLDPLGARGRKRLKEMTEAELQAVKARLLEGRVTQ